MKININNSFSIAAIKIICANIKKIDFSDSSISTESNEDYIINANKFICFLFTFCLFV